MKYKTWLLICVIVLTYLTLNYWDHATNLLLRIKTSKEGLSSLQVMCDAVQTDINFLTWTSMALGALTCALFRTPKKNNEAQQGGPGYPPQGVGSPDP